MTGRDGVKLYTYEFTFDDHVGDPSKGTFEVPNDEVPDPFVCDYIIQSILAETKGREGLDGSVTLFRTNNEWLFWRSSTSGSLLWETVKWSEDKLKLEYMMHYYMGQASGRDRCVIERTGGPRTVPWKEWHDNYHSDKFYGTRREWTEWSAKEQNEWVRETDND